MIQHEISQKSHTFDKFLINYRLIEQGKCALPDYALAVTRDFVQAQNTRNVPIGKKGGA